MHLYGFFKKHSGFIAGLLLVISIVIPYWQVRNNQFVNFDDDDYITQNPVLQEGLNLKNITWAFTSSYACNWHPVTWISHMLDYELFKLNPGAHHLVNVLFHLLNTLLLFLLLRLSTGALWKSWFAAMLFAVHPMHVESVAWIAERKDVLCAFFGLLACICYFRYVKRKSILRYLLVVLCFIFGLMSKPMLVSLPIVLLLLDIWPLKRIVIQTSRIKNDRHDGLDVQPASIRSSPAGVILEKLPLFILAIASCVVTFWVQLKEGAIGSFEKYSILIRIANAITSYAIYLWKMAVPINLACFYPIKENIVWTTVGLSFLFLLAMMVFSVKTVQNKPYILVGWLWYLVTLVPVIGLVQVGSQAMADRYTYIPYIGIFIMISWGISDIKVRSRYWRPAMISSASLVLLILAIKTREQAGYWKNTTTLFKHAASVTKNNYLAYNKLGLECVVQDKNEEATAYFIEAVRMNPHDELAHNNLATELSKQGKADEAIAQYTEALRINPQSARTQYNLGTELANQGRTDEAIGHLKETLRIDPQHFEAHNNLGIILAEKGKSDEAYSHFMEAIKINPQDALAHSNLGNVLYRQGRTDEAIHHFLIALQIEPGFYTPRKMLAIIQNKNIPGTGAK